MCRCGIKCMDSRLMSCAGLYKCQVVSAPMVVGVGPMGKWNAQPA